MVLAALVLPQAIPAQQQPNQVVLQVVVLADSMLPSMSLERENFRILEEGVEQKIVRFERTKDSPVSVGILVDSSGSMGPRCRQTDPAGAGPRGLAPNAAVPLVLLVNGVPSNTVTLAIR